jgi:hypothetical protein
MSKYSRHTYVEDMEYPEYFEDGSYNRRGMKYSKAKYPEIDFEEDSKYWDRFNRMVDEHSGISHHGYKSFSPMSGDHYNEQYAKYIVSNMTHTYKDKEYKGEKFDMNKANEVKERYTGYISSNITAADIYVAINAQYHDYCVLFKSWFGNNIENKIIESAIVFWFQDEDYVKGNKVVEYFK